MNRLRYLFHVVLRDGSQELPVVQFAVVSDDALEPGEKFESSVSFAGRTIKLLEF